MKKTADSFMTPETSFQGRRKPWWSVSNLLTLAAVFVFYMMLAMALGLAFGFESILAATVAAIAWTCADAALRRKAAAQPVRTASGARINP